MYFWLKFFHIASMTVWFTGLFFLPRLFIARVRQEEDTDYARLNAIGKMLYFRVATPAGVATVILGVILIGYGYQGAWLPAKLALVSLVVLLHVYFGQLLLDLSRGHTRHGRFFFTVLNWIPLPLLLTVAALTAVKPVTFWPLEIP